MIHSPGIASKCSTIYFSNTRPGWVKGQRCQRFTFSLQLQCAVVNHPISTGSKSLVEQTRSASRFGAHGFCGLVEGIDQLQVTVFQVLLISVLARSKLGSVCQI